MAFIEGLAGVIFGEFGIAVAAVGLDSLLVSFTVDPMLSAQLVQKLPEGRHARLRRHRVFGPVVRALDALDASYRGVIAWAVGHRALVIGSAVLLFAGSIGLASFVGLEFFGRPDQGELMLDFELPAGTPLAQTDEVTRRVEGRCGPSRRSAR